MWKTLWWPLPGLDFISNKFSPAGGRVNAAPFDSPKPSLIRPRSGIDRLAIVPVYSPENPHSDCGADDPMGVSLALHPQNDEIFRLIENHKQICKLFSEAISDKNLPPDQS